MARNEKNKSRIHKVVRLKEEKPNQKMICLKEETVACTDKFCPVHGSKPLKLRGRTFEGTVIKKLNGRVTIQFERMNYVRKYERYEKRRTKLHARLPDCLKEEINVGDYIKIIECRPLSKIIHFVVVGMVKEVQSK